MQKFPRLFLWAQHIAVWSLVLLPLLFLHSSIYPYTILKGPFIIAVGCIVIGLLITLWIRDKQWKPAVSVPLALFGAYVVWNSIASLFGENFSLSWWGDVRLTNGLLTQIGILLWAFGLSWVAQKKDILRLVATALAISGIGWFACILVGIGQLPNTTIATRFFLGGTLGNNSFAAAYLVASVAATVILICVSKKIGAWVWGAVLAVLLVVNPLFFNIFGEHTGGISYVGHARAATIALAIATIVAITVYHLFSQQRVVRLIAKTTVVVGFIASVAIGALLYLPNTYFHRLFAEFASGNRFVYQDIALQGIAMHPITGFGWNHFPIAYQQLFNPVVLGGVGYAPEAWISEPHNMIVQTGVVGGIPATVLYVIFLGSIVISVNNAIKKQWLGRKEGSVLFGFFVAYIIQNIFLFDIPAAQMAFMALVAGVTARHTVVAGDKPLINHPAARTVTVVGMWAIVVVAIYCFAVRPVAQSIAIFHAQKKPAAYDFVHAVTMTPTGRMYDTVQIMYQRATMYLGSIGSLSVEQQSLAHNELVSYIPLLVSMQKPDFIRTHMALGYIYLALFKESNYQDAELVRQAQQQALQAITLSPRNQMGYWLMAQSLAFSGDTDQAIRFAEMAVQLEPRVLDSHLVLLNIAQFSDNIGLFKKQLDRARDLFPETSFDQFQTR